MRLGHALFRSSTSEYCGFEAAILPCQSRLPLLPSSFPAQRLKQPPQASAETLTRGGKDADKIPPSDTYIAGEYSRAVTEHEALAAPFVLAANKSDVFVVGCDRPLGWHRNMAAAVV